MNAEEARRERVWQDAQLALLALQLDPHGLGGVWLRAGHGPVREAWLVGLQASGLPTLKIPAQVDPERLLGGIDLAQTLQLGRLVQQTGLLAQADGGAILLPMAERLPAQTAAQIAQVHDQGVVHSQGAHAVQTARFAVEALDESEDGEPGLAERLTDRLGLWLDLRDNCMADTTETLEALSPLEHTEALHLLRQTAPSEQQAHAVCEVALALGVQSLRAPLMALRMAAVHAAMQGRAMLEDEDLEVAVRLVLAPRATRLPEAAAPPSAPPPTPAEAEQQEPDEANQEPAQDALPTEAPGASPEQQDTQNPPDTDPPTPAAAPDPEMLIAAALASLPPHLLDRLLLGKAGKSAASGLGSSGQATHSKLRGRPLTPRPGKPGSGARLHVLATLRAAAPKQRIRNKPPGAGRVCLRAEDFHVQRFAQRSPSCLIFALDASGSSALQRLAEAKGAVELLLQDSYARRDSVCVIAFRAASAQVLLAPTRSLVRAKRALAGLPGGGGTPLAHGIQTAMQQAMALQRAGSTPMLVMLSDGRANVSAAGVGGRAQAHADAFASAGQWRTRGFAALWIDTSAQPDAQAQALAQQMGASYFPMPYVQAQRMAAVVQDLTGQRR
jgi:magnesium chelatase subunit D